jgi:hypothetical protein
MSPALQVALEALEARIETAARTGTPLTKATAVALLRAAGVPRDHARRLAVTAGAERWVVARGQTTARGGRPPELLVPVGAPVCADLVTAETLPAPHPEPLDLRARLFAAARAARFPRLEIRCQVVLVAGEFHWQRFAGLATPTEITSALRALGVPWRRATHEPAASRPRARPRRARGGGDGRDGAGARAGGVAAGGAARQPSAPHAGAADARHARGTRPHDAAAAGRRETAE